MINLVFNNWIGLTILRRLRLFQAVFVMYPADQTFADYFTFRLRQRVIKWRPFIVGMITHPSGKRTLMFAISAHVDGKDSAYEPEDLRNLHRRTERIQGLLGANSTHFAGTLPGRLSALRVRRGDNQGNEQRATVENVLKAIRFVRGTHQLPVVILGSKGYVGRKVDESLRKTGISVTGVEKDGVYYEGERVAESYAPPTDMHLLINITRPEVVNDYIDHMGEKTILLNEVYPAPHRDVVAAMKEKGVKPCHIAGVEARVWPSFPLSYQGAIPCCAALPGEDYDVVVIKL